MVLETRILYATFEHHLGWLHLPWRWEVVPVDTFVAASITVATIQTRRVTGFVPPSTNLNFCTVSCCGVLVAIPSTELRTIMVWQAVPTYRNKVQKLKWTPIVISTLAVSYILPDLIQARPFGKWWPLCRLLFNWIRICKGTLSDDKYLPTTRYDLHKLLLHFNSILWRLQTFFSNVENNSITL